MSDLMSQALMAMDTAKDNELEAFENKPLFVKENWQIVFDSPHRYQSWGLHTPIVLIQLTLKNVPGEFQAWCMWTNPLSHIKTFNIKNQIEYGKMIEKLTQWNYHEKCCNVNTEEKLPQKPKRKLDI